MPSSRRRRRLLADCFSLCLLVCAWRETDFHVFLSFAFPSFLSFCTTDPPTTLFPVFFSLPPLVGCKSYYIDDCFRLEARSLWSTRKAHSRRIFYIPLQATLFHLCRHVSVYPYPLTVFASCPLLRPLSSSLLIFPLFPDILILILANFADPTIFCYLHSPVMPAIHLASISPSGDKIYFCLFRPRPIIH